MVTSHPLVRSNIKDLKRNKKTFNNNNNVVNTNKGSRVSREIEKEDLKKKRTRRRHLTFLKLKTFDRDIRYLLPF